LILVTVGQHTQGFPRLISGMDEIAGRIQEEVIMQIGSTVYLPRNAHWFRFADYDEMKRLNKEARVVVTHAGAGSIITALKTGAAVVIVPRLSRYDEVIDDHQLELVKALSSDGRVTALSEVEEVESILQGVARPQLKSTRGGNRLITALRLCLEEFEAKLG
jgi:beta-1,4-N-acetylglucosaminyltransferase